VATVRRPVGAKNGRYKVCPPVATVRRPVGAGAAGFRGRCNSRSRLDLSAEGTIGCATWRPFRAVTARSALRDFRFSVPSCLCATVPPPPRPFFVDFLPIGMEVVHIGVCTSVHVVNRQNRVKTGQNGVKIVSKNDQKRAQIVMPILTFGGVIPSGASAKAVLASRRGKKGAFRGAKSPGQKLSTSWRRLWITPGFLFAAARPLSAMTATRSVPRSAATAAGMRSGCSVTGWHAQAAVCLGMVCAAATRMPTHTAAWACHPATGRSPP